MTLLWLCTQGCTALHLAAHNGHTKAAASLAKAGACDVDAVDSAGRTALHHAAALGHDGVVQALWARGCSVQAEDVDGWTGACPLLRCMLAAVRRSTTGALYTPSMPCGHLDLCGCSVQAEDVDG